MAVVYHPLIKLQRELYEIPRGPERFKRYIETLRDPHTQDMRLPLSAMNPMAKDHVPEALDLYLDEQADEVAGTCLAEIQPQLQEMSHQYQAALVMADDAHGMWTERFSVEFGERFETKPHFRRGWLVGLLWSSERPSLEKVRHALATAVFRGLYIEKYGFASTLQEMMAQEGFVLEKSGITQMLDADELAYSRELIAPHLETDDYPLIMSIIFGDEAAETLGYEPLGLSYQAGLMVALANQTDH
ncbi:MAG: hypothetical protein AAF490_26480 [Chloroflexota bacterium]